MQAAQIDQKRREPKTERSEDQKYRTGLAVRTPLQSLVDLGGSVSLFTITFPGNKFRQVDRKMMKNDKINWTSIIGDKKWHNVDKLFLMNYMPHALGMHKIYSLAYFFLT